MCRLAQGIGVVPFVRQQLQDSHSHCHQCIRTTVLWISAFTDWQVVGIVGVRDWGDALVNKALFHQKGRVWVHSQNPHKARCGGTCLYSQYRGGRKRKSFGAPWPTNLAYNVNPRFSVIHHRPMDPEERCLNSSLASMSSCTHMHRTYKEPWISPLIPFKQINCGISERVSICVSQADLELGIKSNSSHPILLSKWDYRHAL